MPQWIVSEVGLLLCLAGFGLLVREWIHVFRAQGNALAREDLLVYLREWRRATEDATRTANVRRMRELALPEIKHDQRRMYSNYIDMLENMRPDNQGDLDELACSFKTGTFLEDKERRNRRVRLMKFAVGLVIAGTAGQMAGSFADPVRIGLCSPASKDSIWKCP